MGYLVYLVLSLALTVLVPLAIKWHRKGRVTGNGVVRIPKGPGDTVFKASVCINGRTVAGLFDTGASETTIGLDLAGRLGFDTASLYFDKSANTAAGVKHAAIADAYVDEFRVGSITIRNMGVSVNRFGGSQCLVGMNFFDSLDSFEIRDNVLTLRKGPDTETSSSADRDWPRQAPDESWPRNGKTADARLQVVCPHCEARMTLPSGRKGKVRCHACENRFQADTTGDGAAKLRPL